MKIKLRYILILVLASVFFMTLLEAPCRSATKPALLLKKADQRRKALLCSVKKKKYRHNWQNCIDRYEKIYTRYPKSDQAVWAMYHSARLYKGLYVYSRKSKDLDNALKLLRKVVDKYNNHRLADDCQYLIGDIFYKNKKDLAQAYVEFLKVDIKFDSGDMRPKARKMLDKLAVLLSKKDRAKTGKKKKSLPSNAALVEVKDIRHWSTDNYTRVVVDLPSPVKYEHHLLKADPDHKKPRRLYLDLKNARVAPGFDGTVSIEDGLLKGSRAGQYTKKTVRVVLDIKSIGGYKVFHLYDPFRIVLDVRRLEKDGSKKTPRLAATRKKRRVKKGIEKSKSADGTISLARQLGLNVKRIVIDPGHGGKDPGCHIGKNIKEKDLVLNIARLLAKKIKKELGCEVFLTRNSDVFISLERRTAIANMKKADLFISLHVNAHRSKKICGLETYFLNMATDERTVMVAARENATSGKNISSLQTILNDLMMNTKIHESSRLAHEVQKGMVSQVKKGYKPVRDIGVKKAPFYVLIGAQMPAILVETGFLTNSTERKRLVNKKYQERVAKGICEGVTAYIKSIDQVYKGG